MSRLLALAIGAAAVLPAARADDAIAPETVVAVKKATVFVRVEGDDWAASGSGFVVAADDRRVLVGTNEHVIASKSGRARGTPAASVTVVFDSGTKAERSYRAAVVTADAARDLALLRVEGVTDAPRPLAHADRSKLVETTPVYTFGFPFGKALSRNDGFPAVTVGRANVSSLRTGPGGELDAVQIDGNLNPGNSGGPVVDVQGKLVGVAVSVIRDSQGIGFAVPAADLEKLMRGRVGRVTSAVRRESDGTVTVRVEAEVVDPADRFTSVAARYVVVPAGAPRPDPAAFDKHPEAKSIGLTVEKGRAGADVKLPGAGGEILVRVEAGAAGQAALTTPVRAFSLAAGPSATALAGSPPAGWVEAGPADRSFVMWVPAKPATQSAGERELVVGGQTLTVRTLAGKTVGGLAYEGQSAALPAAFTSLPVREVYDLFRGAVVAEFGGRVTDTTDVTMGSFTGVEYAVAARGATARVRVFTAGDRLYAVSVRGPAALVGGEDAETILGAYRRSSAATASRGAGTLPGPKAKTPTVIGGDGPPPIGGAPLVKDVAPAGGLLIGLEVVIGRPYRDELVRSVRPIYRVAGREVLGGQFGTVLGSPVQIKARAGYAVGGITAKARNVCDGFSLTFMRVAGDSLDPADSYESEWAGWDGDVRPTQVKGDGTPVVGFAGRENARDVTGLGLLYKGQEAFDPAAARGPGTAPTILGGRSDPEFKDAAPAGGLLVGFEVGTARAYGRTMTRSVRPIYRAGDKETFGGQRGTQLDDVTTIKAKPGYAVGAISVMHGLGFDGLSVTFMKVAGDRLDPADSYQSGYVGSNENKRLTKLGGDGTPVVGIVGKTNARDLTGMGLLFKDPDEPPPNGR